MGIKTAAIIGLAMALACAARPASAQSAAGVAGVVKNAYQTAKAQCAELVAPYRGGALDGRIVLLDEPLTEAMKADEAVPSEGEAVILRGYMASDAKCSALLLAFVREYMPWDAATEEYARDAQLPIYQALAARQISWGKANRDFDNVNIHTKELRGLAFPKGDNGPAFQAAEREKDQKCQAIYAAVSDRSVGGKLVAGAAPTPAALAIRDRVTDAEAATVRTIRAAHDACGRLTIELAKTYIPWYLPVIQEEQELDDDVYDALANRRISFGEANRRFADIAARIGKDARKRLEALGGKPAAAPQAPAQPMSPELADYQVMATKCQEVIAPLRQSAANGKIPFSDAEMTPAMLSDTSYATDAEALAINAYAEARTRCGGFQIAYHKIYHPWMVAVIERSIAREMPVFHALAQRQMTYAEANRKIADILAVGNTEAQEGAAAAKATSPIAPGPQLASAKDSRPPPSPANQELGKRCHAALDPYLAGSLRGRLAVGYVMPTPDMLRDARYASDEDVATLHGLAGALSLCQAYESRYIAQVTPWLMQAHDQLVAEQRPVFAALIAKQISFGEANRKFADIEARIQAQVKSSNAKDLALAATQPPGPGAPPQSVFQMLQPGGNP